MAKRTRKERRQKQQAKAIQQGDLGALRAIVERNPEAGAGALVTALESGSVDPNEPSIQHLAEQVIDNARDKGRHDQVLRLVALFPSPSTALRLARALSALAIGDDATATADAKADTRVHQLVAPLLAALNGTKIPRTPPKARPSERSILALSRAVAAMTSGSTGPARTALRAVDTKWAPRLGTSELGLMLDLQAKRLAWYNVAHVVRALLKFSLVRAHAPIRRAIAMELAPRFPESLDALLPELDLSAEDRAAVSLRASLADAALDSEQARVSRLIASAGAAAFPPEHRPVAHLFAGFANMASEPKKAKACFDAAIAAGADLGEALRGRVLVDTALGNDAEAARTCLRLAKLLEREPDGAPLAILAAKKAATAASFAQDLRSARQAIELVRALGERTGLLDAKRQAELLIIESHCADINKAGAFLDQAMALDPRNPVVWQARVDLARARGREEEEEELILQAGELQIDEDFVALARQVRAKRGERWEPEPGKATAGELAAELYHRIEHNPVLDLNDDLLRCRAELSPTARVAFDMAHWATLSSFDHDDAAEGLLQTAWRDPDLDDHARNAWVLLAADYGAPESVIPLLVERARTNPDDKILLQACGLMGSEAKSQVNRLIAQLAPFLSRSRLDAIRSAVYRAQRALDDSAVETLLQLLKPFSALLQPHYSLKAVLDGEVPVPRVCADEEEDENFLLRQVLETMGAPPFLIEDASPEQLAEARKIVQAIVTAPSKNKVGKLVERLVNVLEGPTNDYRSIPF